MTKIKLNWAYAKGELDTDTLDLVCIPARGRRVFGPDELDAELCIKDGMNYQIAEIHLGDVESSNILCKEIARRWNEFEEWHECKGQVPLGYLFRQRKKRENGQFWWNGKYVCHSLWLCRVVQYQNYRNLPLQ